MQEWRSISYSFLSAVFLIVVSTLQAQVVTGDVPHPKPMEVKQTAHGLEAVNDFERLEVTVCGAGLIHVVGRPVDADSHRSERPWMLPAAESCPGAAYSFTQANGRSKLKTESLEVTLSSRSGNLNFADAKGGRLLGESPSLPRTYEAGASQPEGTYRIEDRFGVDAVEAIYGLGQHQNGMFNYRGAVVELGHANTDVAFPVLVSTKGYGLMWNTAAFTYFDNRFPLDMILNSAAADGVDYYFMYGPEMDGIVRQYRAMTGHAPMLPAWAYGLFQSKDKYESQEEILKVAGEFRARHIPMDAIVQDWFWWKQGGEGDPEYNANFTNVPAELKTLHNEHVHAMISVWGQMDTTSKTFQEIQRRGFEIPGTHVYDPSSAEARDLYWNRLPGKLFADGWDAFWLDSAEPEEYWPHWGDAILRHKKLAMGSGLEYTNIFPFLHSNGVQENWKAAGTGKRVFLLTRSAFLGQQRVGASVWSGDVYSTWWALKHQIAAGLNFALSGYPYWTTDIGGYFLPYEGYEKTAEYQELYARWFEYGVFCPIFRTHGHRPKNEMWVWDKVFPSLLEFDKLRYRLLPYIYAEAWQISSDDSTIMRPLPMDFRADAQTWDKSEEFMFGPSLLVTAVTRQGAKDQAVYLPAGAKWFDFWTGTATDGGREVTQAAPVERIPLNVRAGSILPLGPQEEWAGKKSDPIELRIYPGADGKFQLYEDAGDGYGYQKGERSTISLEWNDATKTLTVGARQGSFPGMKAGHSFHVVLVRPGHGVGVAAEAAPDKVVEYTEARVEAKF
jgi:alpha-D-xyloside xylohydrolase